MGEVVIGALSLNNFGGRLQWRGRVVASRTTQATAPAGDGPGSIGGSCVVVLATNAPLAPCVLRRIARRAWAGVARAGSSFGDTSGDVALAFALPHRGGLCPDELRWKLPAEDANALFLAAADAAEESIWDCLLAAGDFTSLDGRLTPGLRPKDLLAAAGR